MTVDTTTGEIVEFDRAAAERRAERIVTRLDAIAENYSRVLPMIREAIEKRDDLALGYRSPGDYVSDRFGQSLTGLGLEVRRAVVGELTDAGMSTRAIAPVVGINHSTVVRDLGSRGAPAPPQTPAPTSTWGEVAGAGYNSEDAASVADDKQHEAVPTPSPRPPVTGIDGKTYSRPVAVPKPTADPEYDNAAQACLGFTRAMSRLLTFEHPNMRAGMQAYWALASDEVPRTQRQDVTPEQMRVAARGLLELADEWESK